MRHYAKRRGCSATTTPSPRRGVEIAESTITIAATQSSATSQRHRRGAFREASLLNTSRAWTLRRGGRVGERRRRRLRAVRTPAATSQPGRLRDLPSARLPLRMQHRRRRSHASTGAGARPVVIATALSLLFSLAALAAAVRGMSEKWQQTDREGSTPVAPIAPHSKTRCGNAVMAPRRTPDLPGTFSPVFS